MKKILLVYLLVGIVLNNVSAQHNGTVRTIEGAHSNSRVLNGSGTLGSMYNTNACGLNFAFARTTVSSRSATISGATGLPSTLTISGIPTSCLVVQQAFLWSIVAYAAADPSPATFSVTNPGGTTFNYTSTLIGSDIEKCWGEVNTRTFRADVTTAIQANGNYIINTNSPASSVDGFLLMIIYVDGNATYQGRMIMFDGCNSDNAGATINQSLIFGTPACAASTFARAFNLVSDCQYPAAVVHQSRLNGAIASYPDNFFNFDITNTTITSGQSTGAFGVVPGSALAVSDCFAWGLMGVYFQTTACISCPGGCAIMPLELIDFHAKVINGGTQLYWKTASEKDMRNFEIERSKNGISFSKVTTIPAANNSSTMREYTHTEVNPSSNIEYYRLKMVGMDGKFTYSPVVVVTHASIQNIADLQIQPFEKDGRITVTNLPQSEKPIQIDIYTVTGQLLTTQVVINTTTGSVNIDVPEFSSGYYIIKASSGEEPLGVGKFIK